MTDDHSWTDTLLPSPPDDDIDEVRLLPDLSGEQYDDVAVGAAPFAGASPADGAGWVVDGSLVGDPDGDAEHWFEQSANGYCVPASIAQIVSEYTGVHHADESAFVARANELHLFEVGADGVPGMGIEGAHALLEDAGVPAEIQIGIGVEALAGYLAEGRRVMLAVDGDEIWYAREDEAGADHAVVLTGIDVDRGVAILSDPGTGDGNRMEVPLDVLADAWADSGNAALVCDVPPVQVPGAEPAPLPASGRLPDVVSWLVERPYVVLPVLLVGRALLGRRL
ncbi:hypothetical protein GCM10010112_64840 [Actinoplanes lobatus]|uniref:Peptidase C39-like domain-containing protein n=1 Tax=Actinoplanes lobatus TaxID=113568 RepID=A0A7W7HK56_9ACTN|nr:hypothetical protein [Actinoplanes lobatus]MBB4752038.1 hypothetical protein [Actinoplanes lobatus]GGN84988.1 hypothetical protein GCM10010112_64840 [Actinoplanes lobatus]GIE45367.1 hypothetical protein Alo02nite_82650 [Actinoplanes lobatus]